jgi:hypothetical protein
LFLIASLDAIILFGEAGLRLNGTAGAGAAVLRGYTFAFAALHQAISPRFTALDPAGAGTADTDLLGLGTGHCISAHLDTSRRIVASKKSKVKSQKCNSRVKIIRTEF